MLSFGFCISKIIHSKTHLSKNSFIRKKKKRTNESENLDPSDGAQFKQYSVHSIEITLNELQNRFVRGSHNTDFAMAYHRTIAIAIVFSPSHRSNHEKGASEQKKKNPQMMIGFVSICDLVWQIDDT